MPSLAYLKGEGDWNFVPLPVHGHGIPCSYVFQTPGNVAAGTTITVEATATKGTVVVYAGTDSHLRSSHARAMTLDVMRNARGSFDFEISTASVLYIGVDPGPADAECNFKYTAKEGVAPMTTSAVTVIIILGMYGGLFNASSN